jgi:hypothetical protein
MKPNHLPLDLPCCSRGLIEYDRRIIAEATGISTDNLDNSFYLDMGEWMFVSFGATWLRNITVFIKAPNNEEIPQTRLSSKRG